MGSICITIGYHVSSEPGIYTKRGVLSVIARLYDPVGLLAPVTFWAKEFLQRIWKTGLQWDSKLPQDLADEWKIFMDELPAVSTSSLPRHIVTNICEIHLCGFCDASIKGYAAVVYVRVCTMDKSTVYLLGSKSKVAPVKGLTVPRLELCGALLLAQWLDRIQTASKPRLKINQTFAWTDSAVVLSWLINPQIDYKIFVTNRIAKIQKLLPDCIWNHIPSIHNPADCVSRGLLPSQLWKHTLYWNGPVLLKDWNSKIIPPRFKPMPAAELPELKTNPTVVLMVNVTEDIIGRFMRHSSLLFTQRVVAGIWRYMSRLRQYPVSSGPLDRKELQNAMNILIYITQQHYYHSWIKYPKT